MKTRKIKGGKIYEEKNYCCFDDELESEPFPGDAIIFHREDNKSRADGSNLMDVTNDDSATCQARP